MKIRDLLEFGVGRITKQNQTQDVGPNEIKKQAAKFGFKVDKDGYPPVMHKTAARNSTPNKLMNLGLNEDSVTTLKTAVINQVKKTDDEQLLDKVYTVLNKTNLQSRIQDVISKETDVKQYSAVITDAIISTQGSYQEKYEFIEGYPDGYVDIKKLLSGNFVSFNDFITGNEFTKKVFAKLFEFRPGSSGPGEFALAALSPQVKMRSKGDLYVDGNYIEVKSSAGSKVSSGGGRLGEPGLLNTNGVKELIEKYTKQKITNDIYIQQLHTVLSPYIKDPKDFKNAVTAIINTIFGSPEPELVKAVIANKNIQQAFLAANWKKYKEEAGWAGLLVLNLTGQSARYFKEPQEMFDAVYSLNAIIVSKDTAKASRQILSQITLKGSAASANIVSEPSSDQTAGTQDAPKSSTNKVLRPAPKKATWVNKYKSKGPKKGGEREKR